MNTGRLPADWISEKFVCKRWGDCNPPLVFRQICLLGQKGNLIERIVAMRITRHLSQYDPDQSDQQYGVRNGRSKICALYRVINMIKLEVQNRRGVGCVHLHCKRIQLVAVREYLGAAG